MLTNVQGQSEAVQFLRLVVEGSLTTPLLLVGEEGVGRRLSVIEAAKEMFCKGNEDDCIHCVQIDKGVHPDFVEVRAVDGKDLKIEAIREVIAQAYSFPSRTKARFFVIEGVDRMTVPAANALLKTLEDPPRISRFFLLAENADKVLPTIRSRCGLVRYRPLPEAFILDYLSRIEKDRDRALVYSRLAEGSVGRAVRFLGSNQLRLRNQALAILKKAHQRDLAPLFLLIDETDELPLGLRFLDHLLHDLVMISQDPSRITNNDLAEDLPRLREEVGPERVDRLRKGLREIANQRSAIMLPFHVKALMVEAFA